MVYLPLCIQTGLTGQIFGQLGYTIIIAMLASLISALTLVPLFFCIFKPQEKKELKLNGFLDKVKEKYDRLERKLLHKKKLSCLLYTSQCHKRHYSVFENRKEELIWKIV